MGVEKNYMVSSTQAEDFTSAIAAQGSESETLDGWRADGRGTIEVVRIKSADKRAWLVELLDENDDVARMHAFSESDGRASAGWYYYFVKVSWPNIRRVTEHTLTTRIVNLSNTAKTATSGDTGALILTLEGRK